MDELKLYFPLIASLRSKNNFLNFGGRFEAHKGMVGLSFPTELAVKCKMIRGRRKEIHANPNTFDWRCRDARVGAAPDALHKFT